MFSELQVLSFYLNDHFVYKGLYKAQTILLQKFLWVLLTF